MPNIPTVGVFIPSYLNTTNSPGPSGQQDAYGMNYPSGLTPGKVIELAPGEAQALAAPGTTLYDGAYQYVLLDSGATAAYATVGMAAYIKLDSGATAGTLPETAYEAGAVTTYDQVSTSTSPALLAGVFINPATVGGVSTAPTAGYYCFIFVGAGRVVTNITTAGGTPAIGDLVYPNGTSGSGFLSANTASVTAPQLNISLGAAVTVPASGKTAVTYCRELFYRISNQGV